jgi:mannosyltransferase
MSQVATPRHWQTLTPVSVGPERVGPAPLVLAAYGFAISFAAAWIPGYWGDEGAGVTMARKPFGDFVATLADVDAVHGTYYLALREWGAIVGFSEGGTRSLSALAVGATCAVLMLLGLRLADRPTAVAAALVYTSLPAVFEQATQARSYVLAALLSALFVLACTRAWDQPRSWLRWAVVGGLVVVSTWVFLYSLLAAPLVLAGLRRVTWRQARLRMVVTFAVVGVLVAPIVVLGMTQRGQIAWIPQQGVGWLGGQIVGEQYFLGLGWWVVGGWLLAAVGLWRLAVRQSRSAALLAAWVVVPTGLLLAGDLVVPQVLYQSRYLMFTAPALALALGAAVTWLRPRVLVPLAVVAAAVASLPLAQDRLDDNSRSSWRYAEGVLAERAQPGDALIAFAPLMTIAENVYPDPMADLRLVNVDPASPWLTAAIYPRMGGPLDRTLEVPDDVRRVWYLSERTSRDWRTSDPDGDALRLRDLGFAPVWEAGPSGYDDLVITLYER